MIKKCLVCEKEFKTNYTRQIFCNLKCNIKYLKIKRLKNIKIKKCKICNKEFKTFRNKEIYCNKECYFINNRINRKKYNLKEKIKNCKICGKEFKTKQYNKLFCSNKCSLKNKAKNDMKQILQQLNYIKNMEIKKCLFCNKDFIPKKNLKKNNKYSMINYCSIKCKKKHSRLNFKKEHKDEYKICLKFKKIIKQNFEKYSIKKEFHCKELLGCSYKEYLNYLNFPKGINIINYGKMGFHIDHYIPVSFFDLTDKIQQKLCFNYRNTRLIPAKENLLKNNKLPNDYIEFLENLKKEIGVI